MNASITCPHCSARLKLGKPLTGNVALTCPKCWQPIVVKKSRVARSASGSNLWMIVGSTAAVLVLLALGVGIFVVIAQSNPGADATTEEVNPTVLAATGGEKKEQKKSTPTNQKKKLDKNEGKTPYCSTRAKTAENGCGR